MVTLGLSCRIRKRGKLTITLIIVMIVVIRNKRRDVMNNKRKVWFTLGNIINTIFI
jgi:hypothetical protein